MAKRVFVAPARGEPPAAIWQQPAFARFAGQVGWFTADDWPTLDAFNEQLAGRQHAITGLPLRFVEQTMPRLDDGLHYETRIAERGEIATRRDNWHDLFNAAVWVQYTGLKSAMNARQAADIAVVGAKQRTRGQYALTQFDEAGVVVLLRDPGLLALWDAHDWHGLFFDQACAWRDGRIELGIIGHALLEMALCPSVLLAAKCLVVASERLSLSDAIELAVQAILAGSALQDPQDSRPLPLAGIPGWHADAGRAEFYALAPCFRPLRPGRQYPPVISPLGLRSVTRLAGCDQS